jgi:myosin heavy subunit
MISNLSLARWKGSDRSYSFGSCNLVQGRNFSGKTAIEQAIRALVLGYVPGLKPETSASLKQFASGYPMSIRMQSSIGTHAIAFDKVKSAVKQTEDSTSSSSIDEATRVLFDPSIFFGLTDAARITKACELVQSTGGTPEDIMLAVSALLGAKLAQQHASWRVSVSQEKTINDLLAASETYWKQVKSELTAEKGRMQKMAEGMTDLTTVEAELARLPQRHEVEARKVKLWQEIRALTERIASAKSLAQATAQRAARIAEITPLAADVAVTTAERDRLASEATQLEAELESLRTAHSAALAEFKLLRDGMAESANRAARLQRLQVEARALDERKTHVERVRVQLAHLRESTGPEIEERIKKATAELGIARAAVALGEKERATAAGARTDYFQTNAEPGVDYNALVTLQMLDGIPRVVSIEKWWRDLTPDEEEQAQFREAEALSAVHELESDLEELRNTQKNIAVGLTNWSVELTKAEGLLEASTKAAAELATQVNGSLPATTPESVKFAEDRTAACWAAVLEGTRRVKACRTKFDVAAAGAVRASEASAELVRLNQPSAVSTASPEEIAAWTVEHEAAQAEYKALEETLQSVTRFEQDRKRVEDAAKIRTEVEARLKLVGSVLDLLTQKKRELVSGSIEAPLAVANKLAAGILKGPLVFEEGEIGMRVGDTFISSRLFSGTETALVCMGLTAGLAHRSKLRVLLLDEIGRLDRENACSLLANLRGMVVDGDIDQCILFGPANPELAAFAASHDMNVIDVA